jgi:hypothetical protein
VWLSCKAGYGPIRNVYKARSVRWANAWQCLGEGNSQNFDLLLLQLMARTVMMMMVMVMVGRVDDNDDDDDDD